ncbi:hypothetical protein DICVIV_12325 [Dictyocaulus viviparus]|uniref:Uncharacterized protein n=1 Tax=Dictyocaulus viviparus TaxID=29172 RepID=A0A0D8XAT1_DICVI|nr:hypothetical protein DICVIV_12325 [Dictyocaulus viviparus]
MVESMEYSEEDAIKTIPDLEQQIADVDSQLETLESNDSEDLEAQLKVEIEEERQLSEQLAQRSGDAVDLDVARRQTMMWRALLTMFEAKIFITKDKKHEE